MARGAGASEGAGADWDMATARGSESSERARGGAMIGAVGELGSLPDRTCRKEDGAADHHAAEGLAASEERRS